MNVHHRPEQEESGRQICAQPRPTTATPRSEDMQSRDCHLWRELVRRESTGDCGPASAVQCPSEDRTRARARSTCCRAAPLPCSYTTLRTAIRPGAAASGGAIVPHEKRETGEASGRKRFHSAERRRGRFARARVKRPSMSSAKRLLTNKDADKENSCTEIKRALVCRFSRTFDFPVWSTKGVRNTSGKPCDARGRMKRQTEEKTVSGERQPKKAVIEGCEGRNGKA